MAPRIVIPAVIVLGLGAIIAIVALDPSSSDGSASLAGASGQSNAAIDGPDADYAARSGASGDRSSATRSGSESGGDANSGGSPGGVTARSVETRAADRRSGGRRGGMAQAFRDTIEASLREFDADGDGALSPEEREAMFQSRIYDADSDGDGLVTIRERVEARTREFLESPMGERIVGFFDQDGDGVLNAEEQARFDERAAQRQQRSMDRLLKEHDADGDGVMSDNETLAMQDAWIDQQRQFFDSVTEQFDEDGDGQLDLDERDDAWETARRDRERGRFLRRYDTNGDGRIGDTDHERFVSAYESGEPLADVNRDDVVNMDDLMAYRDMTESLERNRP